jgi:hypothetical protein
VSATDAPPRTITRTGTRTGTPTGTRSSTRSIVVETWNLGSELRERARVVEGLTARARELAPQRARTSTWTETELVVTHPGLDPCERGAVEDAAGGPITWCEVPPAAGYYQHKNLGFDAAGGDAIAFLDGDCAAAPTWLAAITDPIADGEAGVVAGLTSYPGPLAPLANAIDFPYFDAAGAPLSPAAPRARTVRNFFANNVAFSRAAFAPRRFPTVDGMFHGQCQVLGLALLRAGVSIAFAAGARVTHAWPEGAREWLRVRLLRGADCTALLPHVVEAYAPRATATVSRLGPLPALALIAARAVPAAARALRGPSVVRGLGLVGLVTGVDAVGALAAPAVHRRWA